MMNRSEREQLIQFLEQLTQATAVQQDSEADALIRAACARQPATQYLLVQRAILAERTLQDLRGEIARLHGLLLQASSQSPATDQTESRLDANAWGNSVAARPDRPSHGAAAQSTEPTGAPASVASAWGSGMLGTIATTAAGVVAGGLLFQGIGHLLGNAGGMDGQGTPSTRHGSAPGQALDENKDGDSASAGVFDTTSVDDYIASAIDDTDSL